MIDGYYYLHENGELIYKRYLDDEQVADFRESNLVKMFWGVDLKDRSTCWEFLVEASFLGAKKERIEELHKKWGIDNEDGKHYLEYLGLKLFQDGDQQCITGKNFTNLQESPAGFGDDIFSALVDLCKNLGYKAQKMWGQSFGDLVKML